MPIRKANTVPAIAPTVIVINRLLLSQNLIDWYLTSIAITMAMHNEISNGDNRRIMYSFIEIPSFVKLKYTTYQLSVRSLERNVAKAIPNNPYTLPNPKPSTTVRIPANNVHLLNGHEPVFQTKLPATEC